MYGKLHGAGDRLLQPTSRGGPSMIRAALDFSRSRHEGQVREVDGLPFIAHPLEVGRLLRRDRQPDEVVAAGLLHDVLEKTATTVRELEHEFGPRIAHLVATVSEDPSIDDFDERKRDLRNRVALADSDTFAIYAADKIAKVREHRVLSRSRAGQSRHCARLAHYHASLDMLLGVAGESGLVIRLQSELNRLDSSAGPGPSTAGHAQVSGRR